MSHPLRKLMVGLCSVATGVAVAFVLSLIEIATDLVLYGFSAAVVIPVGAIGCGFVAAAGFFVSSRVFHVRPQGAVLGIPLVTAVITFFSTHWFSFQRYELPTGLTWSEVFALDGRTFVDYLQMIATETGMTLGSSADSTTISRLGSWGYGVVAIEILGFALGGWFVAHLLRRKPWCEDSGRFLTQRGRHVSYFEDPGRFEATANHLVDVLERGGPRAAFDYAGGERPTMKQKRKAHFVVTTTYFTCGECAIDHAVIATKHRVNNNWTQLSQTPLHPEQAFGAEASAHLVS